MGRLSLLILVVLALVPWTVSGQDPPAPPRLPTELPVAGTAFNQVWNATAPILENETREDLRNEEIEIDLLLDIRDAELSVLEILFGGGRVSAAARCVIGIDFHAVSVSRLDEALRTTTGDANISLRKNFGIETHRMVLTAEEIRLVGGGVLLQAFQALQEEATKRLIEGLLPGVSVMEADFEWSNILPLAAAREQDYNVRLREPPLRLDAKVGIAYLDRYSAIEIVRLARESQNRTQEEEAEKALKEQIEENQTVPAEERNAFMFLGYSQLIDVSLPQGWRMNMTMQVPKGYTIEAVSEELILSGDHRSASYFVDGSNRTSTFSTAGVATVSNRFGVTGLVIGATIAVALVARLVLEASVFGSMAFARYLHGRRTKPVGTAS